MNKVSDNMARKLPAFTLPELVVGMLLMSIVFSFISMVYLIFSRQAGKLLETNRYTNEYRATRRVVRYDFEKAVGVYYNTTANSFILKTFTSSGKTDSIVYSFHAKGIVRSHAGHTDTLQPGATVIDKTFVSDTLLLINHITLEQTGRFNNGRLYLQKKYAITDLLNQRP
jgi:type II secretory pathway pseudopilin PulG